jgi:hypothetical protein
MATAPKPQPEPRVWLNGSGGCLRAEYPWKVFRFLFEDGETLDVEAIRDDSDLREAVLTHHYGKKITDPRDGRIEGVAVISKPKPVKRVTRRV